MRKSFLYYFFGLIALIAQDADAQCPTIQNLKVNDTTQTEICAPDHVELSLEGIQLPSEGTIRWYYSEDENFDPRVEGTLIGTTQLPKHEQASCPKECPDLLMIMMNSCDGDGTEADNEFFIFKSGSGFYANDLQFSFNYPTNTGSSGTPPNQNNSINIGTNPCGIQKPSQAFIDKLRSGACSNLNLFPAGPGDFIPADALVIFYTSNDVTFDYDINTLCNSGHNVYVMQSACKRTMGAFTNVTSSNNKTRNNMLSLKNCACRDSLNYTLEGVRNLEGEYIIDKDYQLASVANGSILLNELSEPCQTPELSKFYKPSDLIEMDLGIDRDAGLCGKTIYFKAYVTPSDESICSDIIAEGASLKIRCGGDTIQASAPNAVCSGSEINISLPAGEYSWTVQAPTGVDGLSNGSGEVSSIIQTPIYNGDDSVTVKYIVTPINVSCAAEPATVSVVVYPTISADAVVTPVGCSTLDKGRIEWTHLKGIAPFTFEIDGTPVINPIDDLDSGSYTIVIQDSKGCKAIKQVDVGKTSMVKVTLPEDKTISEGQTVLLKPTSVVGINTQTDSTQILWTPAFGLSCDTCIETNASPDQTTEYELKVTNAAGCFDTAHIVVRVIPLVTVDVPSAFSPNNDGKNDVAYVLSSSSETLVKLFEIYNRWGQRVFKVRDVQANDKSVGWNGTYKGRVLPADAYTYFYEVELPNSEVKRGKGSIIIIR